MRQEAKLVRKYQVREGINQESGMAWKFQDIKFVFVDKSGKELYQSIIVTVKNELLINSPALVEGATGYITVSFKATDGNTDRGFNNITLTGFIPASFEAIESDLTM